MPRLAHELTVREAADQRRSIRRYTADPVPESDLRDILRIVGEAPSAWNVQPWRAVVVREPALKAQLAAAANGQKQVASAPAVVVLYSDIEDVLAHLDETIHPSALPERREKSYANVRKHFGGMTAEQRAAWAHGITYIALGYLLLAAESLGYSTSPMLGFKVAEVKALLALPAHVTVPALVAIGIGEEDGQPKHRHAVDRIATFR